MADENYGEGQENQINDVRYKIAGKKTDQHSCIGLYKNEKTNDIKLSSLLSTSRMGVCNYECRSK